MNHKKKILIIDDDEEILVLLQAILAPENFEVIQTVNAEEALEKLENQDVDLAISGLRLPGMSGIDFLNELREWNTRIPVIFIGAESQEKDLLEDIRSHASTLISKPFRKETILKAVHKVLREEETSSTF